jgi:hypothetical protein
VADDNEAEFKALTGALKKATDDVKSHAETVNTELRNLGLVVVSH